MKNIPKKCHFFWNGLSMMWLQTLGLQSFHKYNPDWDIRVYVTKQRPEEFGYNYYVNEYHGEDYFHILQNLDYITFKEIDLDVYELPRDASTIIGTDVFRTRILYNEGGVYSDHDVLWLKPMSEFVNIDCIGDPHDFESVACLFKQTHGHHNISVLISEVGSLYMESLIKEQRTIVGPYSDQKYSAEMLNRIYPTLDSIRNKYPRVLGLKYETFYPYSTFNMGQLFQENDLTPLESKDVMCIHWFANNNSTLEYVYHKPSGECGMDVILRNEGWV
jgi:hypothetical protein